MNNKEILNQVPKTIAQKPIQFTLVTEEEIEVESTEFNGFKKFPPWKKRVVKKTEVVSKEHHFFIQPPKIGVFEILSMYLNEMELDYSKLETNGHEEVNRICAQHPEAVRSFLAVATLSKKEDIVDDNVVAERAEFFRWNMTVTDMVTVFMAVYSLVDYANFINSMRLTKIFDLNKKIEPRADDIE